MSIWLGNKSFFSFWVGKKSFCLISWHNEKFHGASLFIWIVKNDKHGI